MNTLSVTQIMLSDNGGMSYIITLDESNFIMIDGGVGFEMYKTHEETLCKFLYAHSTEKPKIHGWFFTHHHFDHVSFAAQFLINHTEDIEVEGFYINPYGNVGEEMDLNMKLLLDKAFAAYPKAKIHYLKTGENIKLPSVTADIWLSESDISPLGRANQNHISAALKFTFDNGRSFVVFGDCDAGKTSRLIDPEDALYRKPSELSCDILQVAHHGLPMGDDEQLSASAKLMKMMSPSICFFPQHKSRFESDERFIDERWHDNYFLLHSGAKCYHHSATVTVHLEDMSTTVEE